MLDQHLTEFVFTSLPASPMRVLEVGAGDGELAQELVKRGYDVVAIDPASTVEDVRPVRLHELDEPAESFDAAVAVLSMHHVEPLPESCRRLASLVRVGGRLVLDEIDVERFNERTARWWLENQEHGEDRFSTPQELLDFLRHHCHSLEVLLAALDPWFELEQPVRGPYLYRWQLPLGTRETEVELIAAGELPATGARIVAVRRDSSAADTRLTGQSTR